MKPANSRIKTINGDSSSIKFALFEVRRLAPTDSGGRDFSGDSRVVVRVIHTDEKSVIAKMVFSRVLGFG